jgi:hypothetical protein
MSKKNGHAGLRMLLAAATLALLGICAGAAVPGTASADDDDNGGRTTHICTGEIQADPAPLDDLVVQHCVIEPEDGTDEKCVQQSSAPKVEQRCEFTQTSAMSNLRMTALQVHNPEGGPSGEQDATQVISGIQTNTSTTNRRNSNLLFATQIAAQCLGHGDPHEDDDDDWNDDDHDGDRDDDGRCEDEEEEDGDDEEGKEDDTRLSLLLPASLPTLISQSQEAHQTIDALQKAANGRDEAYALQIQRLHESAANATTIDQLQNTDDRNNECGEFSGLFDPLDANACFSITQESDTGRKIAKLIQDYRLSQRARNTTAGTQEQGPAQFANGGLEHNFDQEFGTGTSTQVSDQIEHLIQRRHNTGGMTFFQNAAPRKGVGLQSGANSTADMSQDVLVKSSGPGFGNQEAFLQILCESDGNCHGVQRAETNDASYFDEQNGNVISMEAICEDVGENGPAQECFAVNCSFDEGFFCFPEGPTLTVAPLRRG